MKEYFRGDLSCWNLVCSFCSVLQTTSHLRLIDIRRGRHLLAVELWSCSAVGWEVSDLRTPTRVLLPPPQSPRAERPSTTNSSSNISDRDQTAVTQEAWSPGVATALHPAPLGRLRDLAPLGPHSRGTHCLAWNCGIQHSHSQSSRHHRRYRYRYLPPREKSALQDARGDARARQRQLCSSGRRATVTSFCCRATHCSIIVYQTLPRVLRVLRP